MPTHYGFKTTGQSRIDFTDRYLERVNSQDREVLKAKSLARWSGEVTDADREEVARIIADLDDRGRWVEDGHMRPSVRGKPRIPARVISVRTFNRNLGKLTRLIALSK